MSWPEKLVESLGRGRLGETWFTRSADGRLLVTKRLRPADGDVDRLADAIRLVAAVRHPALVPIVEVTPEGEGVWVRSELMPGVPLQRLIVIAVLTPAQAALIGRGVLDGLAALTEAGMAHGDVHANNVHVGPDGGIRLSDGGLLPVLSDGDGAHWTEIDAVAVGDLMQRVAGDERRRGPAWRAASAQDLLGAVGAVRRASGDGAIEAALGSLRQVTVAVLPDAAHPRVAGELGALVGAVSLRTPPRTAPVADGPTVPPPPGRFAIPQLSRRARRRVILGALLLVVGLSTLLLGWRWLAAHRPVARPPAAIVTSPVSDSTVTALPPAATGAPR